MTDAQTGLAYLVEQPIAERIERLRARIDAWLALRHKANAEKRIVMLYYNRISNAAPRWNWNA